MKHFVQRIFGTVGYSLHRKTSIDRIFSENESLRRENSQLTALGERLGCERDKAFEEKVRAETVNLSLNREVAIRHAISVAIGRYFSRGLRTPEVSIPIEQVRVDSSVDWIPEILERSCLVEPEFSLFRFFDDPAETILDIGANYGYSAASIWASGSAASILSFEPNPWHFGCLQAIKDLKKGRFDFVGLGLGASAETVCFTIPVVDGKGISALSSASMQNELDWAIPENLVTYALESIAENPEPRFQFAEVRWPVMRLDDALRDHRFEVATDRIAAVKLDVENFEAEVIAGANETLKKHRPLLLVEGANRAGKVVQQLSDLDFHFGDFRDDQIVLTSDMSHRVGGFFLHVSRLQEYRDKGLLVE